MATIKNDRDNILQAAPYRLADTLVTVTSTTGTFRTPKNGALTVPSSATLTATPNIVFTGAALYTWHYALNTTPTTWVPLGTGLVLTLTSDEYLDLLDTATAINFRCTATENLLTTAYGFYTISYSIEASDPIIVDISRSIASILSDSQGIPISFTNTDATISVSRGTPLAYSATGGANTFSVSIEEDSVPRTLGTISTTSTTYTLNSITAITVDVASVVFIVKVYDAAGRAILPTIAKKITYTKVTNGMIGEDAAYYYINTTSPIITKSTSSPTTAGTHSVITVRGKKVVGTAAPINFGYITITGNGDTEASFATSSTTGITTAINNTANKTAYTVRMYNQATVSGAILLDTMTIPVLFTGSSAVMVALTNDTASIPTNSVGSSGIYDNTGTDIYVYQGTQVLLYDGSGTLPGTWKVASTSSSNITVGLITDQGTFARVGLSTNLIAATAYTTYNISGTTLEGTTFSVSKKQTFNRAPEGVKGDTGASGTKSTTISAFKWGTSIGTYTKAVTYTWSGGGVSAYPAGWSASAPASTATGQTLYQINLTITDIATATSTVANWSTAVTNQLGYRQDGSIGLTGNSARVAYIVTTSSTPPARPTSLSGDRAPTGWSFTATAVLSAGQYMYQSDGILTTGGNIAWGIPYLSNLKVGSLSALSANLGTVSISTVGSLSSTGKTYGNATSGVFLGYSGSAYKFDVGNGTNYLRWDGSNLSMSGTIYATAGQIGGNTIDATSIHSGTTGYGTGDGFYLGSDGKFSLGDKLTWNGSTLSVNGGGTFTGNVSGGQFTTGAYTGYVWPAINNYGTYLGPGGLLLGNDKNNKYFQVTHEGNVYAPGFNIVDGIMDLRALNVVKTVNIAGNAATILQSGESTGGTASVSFTLKYSADCQLIGTAAHSYASTIYMAIDGQAVSPSEYIQGTAIVAKKITVSAGYHTFQTISGGARASIIVFASIR